MNSCYSCDCDLQEGEGITSEITGEIYCEECYWDEFGHCDNPNCGCECYSYELTYTEDQGYLCESCYEEYEEEHNHEEDEDENIIRGYHNRDLPLHFLYLEDEIANGIDKNKLLYFGLELEVYNTKKLISKNKMAKMIREKYPELELVFEEDCSLGYSRNDAEENGFEIIFQPMTIKFIKSNREIIEDILNMLSENGFTSHNNNYCGLHIHFSRNYFEDNEDKYIQKLTLFFETYKEELKNFSRRKNFEWCSFISDCSDINKRYLKSSVILKDYAKDHPSHNIAINLGNSSTIEIRIFKGTLKFETLMSSIELVNSLVTTIKTKETRKINFDNLINMAGNEYIKEYCESRNIYNSQYMNDETKNVFKELETRKEKIENVKEQCKTELETTLKDMAKLTKETEINFDDEDIRTTLNILASINNILSDKIRYLKSESLVRDNKRIEECYKNYISRYSFNNPVDYYSNLVSEIGYVVNSNDNELMNKLRDLYNTAKDKLSKLNDLMNNNNTTLQGEE